MQIRPEHVGPTRKNTYLWLATSREWTDPRPINTYVIEHRNGLVVFDTGQDRASVTDPTYFPSGFTGLLYDRLARFDRGPDQTLTRQLAALGHANIMVSEQEWSCMQRPMSAMRGFLRSLEWAEAGEQVSQLELVAAQRRMEERIPFDPGSLLGEDVSDV